MAFTTYITVATDDVLTAAQWNAQVRDNGNHLANFHGARVYHSSNQSVSNASILALSFNSEDFDTDGYHSTGASTSLLTVPSGLNGYYSVTCSVSYAASSGGTGERQCRINKNGSVEALSQVLQNSASFTSTVQCSAIVNLAVGDTIECAAFQNSGGSLNAVTGRTLTFASMTWIGY